MKLSAVYKSSRKADTYLYLPSKDKFDSVPKELLAIFGRAVFVTLISHKNRKQVAGLGLEDYEQKLSNDGFYLQLPPKTKSLLESHRESLGLSAK